MCDACAIAKVNPRAGRFNAGCDECTARAIAQEPEFFECVAAEAITPRYRARLQRWFGGRWKEGHEMVKQAAHRIKR